MNNKYTLITEHRPYAICPYCACVSVCVGRDPGEAIQTTCDSCKKDFSVTKNVYVDYTSRKILVLIKDI